MLLIVKRTVT